MTKNNYSLNTELLYSKLKYKHLLSEQELNKKHASSIDYLEKKGIKPSNIRQHAANLLATGVLAGSLLLLPSPSNMIQQENSGSTVVLVSESSFDMALSGQLQNVLPEQIGLLNTEQETKITKIIKQICGVNAVAELEGNRLNQNYGLIGAEQHLPRYPGDSLDQHGEYLQAGITPGLGGWGYFTYSKNQLNSDLIQKEKYYVAVQTLYLPDWGTRTAYLSKWYKHRKVIVVNPQNGKAVVAVVADAGPSDWTGKHFGGSPEVMAYLKLNVGMQKGPVVLLFVDDPQNNVLIGPLEYNAINNADIVRTI